MTFCEIISRFEKNLRKALVGSFPYFSCFVYSYGRKFFLGQLVKEKIERKQIPHEFSKKIWGLHFQSPLFNAAGMFKDGKGYELAYLQGAGAFLAGTVTPFPKKGNQKKGILHPFIPYPRSSSSSNWMGLPNPGLKIVLDYLNSVSKKPGVPLGLSISSDSDSFDSLERLCQSLFLIQDSNVDFVEINESCPNVLNKGTNLKELDSKFVERIEYISQNFLRYRKRNLPVVIKLSNDFSRKYVPELIDTLIDLGYDGLNFGNTSTDYSQVFSFLDQSERKSFEFFVLNFGGGISGKPLKEKSFELTGECAKYLKKKELSQEFHIIRTGGIMSYDDISQSEALGVSLFQWFTGYFENFEKFGHNLYKLFFPSK